MIAVDLGAGRVDEALRLVRALGSHRYVAGRMHMVHVFAFAGLTSTSSGDADTPDDPLADARAWARATMGIPDIDLASRDERLWRRSTDAEVVAVLDAYWTPSARADAARGALREILSKHELEIGENVPFDEAAEDLVHPLVVDAGWELLQLSELDVERHKGVIGAFGEPIEFASACFEEETAIPREPYLVELPALGAAELLRGATDTGDLAAPFVIWTQGPDTYLDYLLRGISRAAKLPTPAAD
jgi:hypothetical protein